MKPDISRKLQEYYQKDSYRGFQKVNERVLKFSGMTILTFSNGNRTIHVNGFFTEEALANGFEAIDKYHSKLQSKEYDISLE